MAQILVVHPDMMSKGGSEAVCMNTLSALEGDHDVTLLTDEDPDIGALNQFFDTGVSSIQCETRPRQAAIVSTIASALSNVTTVGLSRLRKALLARVAERIEGEYDIVVSTKNELAIEATSVHYIHSPKGDRTAVPGVMGSENPVQPLYDAICDVIGGSDPTTITSSTLIANSNWTADVVETIYSVRPTVIYPPVDTSGFDPRPWNEREDGFVTIGRIARTKNLQRSIEILTRLRDRGHDVHLHLVGPTSHRRYRKDIEARIADLYFVHLEGEVPRERLTELVSTHKYGLHTRTHEHFGIAVAELVAGGAIPFVPDSGGQTEVVGEQDDLCYETTDDAVEKIDRVLSDESRQRALRGDLPDADACFGRERFKEQIRTVIEDAIDETG